MNEIVVNLVQPHVRTIAAKLQRGNPILTCTPSTSEEKDVLAAKVGDRVINAEWYSQNIDMRRLEMSMWLGATGNAFFHTFFDPDRGPYSQGVKIGEIVTNCLSPFKICVEPHRSSIDQCRWSIIDEVVPLDIIHAKYGKFYLERTGSELHVDMSRSSDFTNNIQSFTSSMMSSLGLPSHDNHQDDEFALISYMYHLPSPRFPKGLYAVVAGEKLLYVGDYHLTDKNGNPFDTLPIFHFKEILSPWRFMGESSASIIKAHQGTYENLRNMEQKILRRRAMPKLLVPEGTQIDEEDVLDPEVSIIRYRASANKPPPQWDNGGQAPNGIYNSLDLTRRESDASSGMNEVSRGAVDSKDMSGRAIIALQEQDETRLGQAAKLAEAEFSRWGSCVLFMIKRFYTEPRKYAITGKGLQHSVLFFDSANLLDTSDVRCEPGSALPLNRYAKQQFVMQMFNSGIMGNIQSEETQMRARKMLEFGQFNEVWDDDAQDEAIAEKENDGIIQIVNQLIEQRADPAMVIPTIMENFGANQWDNHLAHIKVHLRTFKSPGIRDNKMMSYLFQQIIGQHAQFLNPQQQQVAAGMAQQGLPQLSQSPVATNNPVSENSDQQITNIDGGT